MNYNDLIRNTLYNTSKNNDSILLILKKEFDILKIFSHIIKKKSLKIYFYVCDYNLFINMKNNIIGEELEDNIIIFQNFDDIKNKDIIFNIINVYSISSINYIESILYYIDNFVDIISTNIEIYCTLSNEENKYILYKNYIRKNINNISNIAKITNIANIVNIATNIDYVIPLKDFINCINDNDNYEIKSLNIYKNSNYILYGNNIIYKVIINKK